MIIKDLGNGLFKLSSLHGVMDIRNRMVHSEVICKKDEIRFFVAAG